MDINKYKESIQIAEEISKEICTGKDSTSRLVKEWKKNSAGLHKELQQQQKLAEEIKFRDSIELEGPLRNIHQRISPSRKLFIRTSGIAASLILAVALTSLWLWQKEEREAVRWASTVPGKEPSSIITCDNRAVTLKENRLSVVDNQLISSTSDGKKDITITVEQDLQLNRLVVPAGAEQVLTLEDGTIVQINAASELLFPTHFTKQARQIQLVGEAYLKVKADKENPFIVHLGILDVQVTGTAFNVKAYEEENEISIALVEGIISVYKEKQLLAELLPGQLFTFRKDEQEYTVADTDLSTVTDWTEDQFIFYNETIENIMHKISRWYNVNISVDEKIKNARYTGILSRKQPLVKILDALRMTDELEFDIQADKKIDVEKKN